MPKAETFDAKVAEARFDAEMVDIYRKTGEAFGYCTLMCRCVPS